MLNDMKKVLDRNPSTNELELKRVANRLMAKQFIYRFDSSDRDTYYLLKEYLPYFTSLFDALGHKMVIDDDYGYAGLIPEFNYRKMKLEETLFLLVARLVYEEDMKNMKSNSDIAYISYEAFLLRYETLTNRERPERNSGFKACMAVLSRFGVIKLRDLRGQDGDSMVEIYPGIMGLINKNTLDQIKEFNNDAFNEGVAEDSEEAE